MTCKTYYSFQKTLFMNIEFMGDNTEKFDKKR